MTFDLCWHELIFWEVPTSHYLTVSSLSRKRFGRISSVRSSHISSSSLTVPAVSQRFLRDCPIELGFLCMTEVNEAKTSVWHVSLNSFHLLRFYCKILEIGELTEVQISCDTHQNLCRFIAFPFADKLAQRCVNTKPLRYNHDPLATINQGCTIC